jgi:anti-anti-sigma factor
VSDDAYADFELHVAFGDDLATVAVVGEVDLLTAPALASALNALVDAGRHHLVVDLAGCRLMDASGLGVLVGVAARLSESDGTVAVRSASGLTRQILDITHVSDFIVYEASEVSATSSSSLGPEEQVDSDRDAADGRAAVESLASSTALVRSSVDVIDAALRLVTALADATVDNADGVSVTLERHGQLMTAAASNDKVLTMDRHQYETGEGPCLDAKAEGRWYYIESLDDETRWPNFVPLALGQGIHSILSSPLLTNNRPQGALNIYSSRQRAFGTREQELAALFADQASEILTTAGTALTDEQANERFATAMTERRTIHQAQGMIMARDNLTADEAISSLFREARTAGGTVLSYATALVAAASDESR